MQDTQKTPTRILIVDDHPVVLSGCRALFAGDSSIRIEEASDAKSGHRAFTQKKPDVTIIDINLPDVSGFELMRRIRKDDPEAKIIMFSMNDDPAFVVRAVEMGAQGYVSKGDDPRLFVKAVRKVAAGDQFITPQLAEADVFRRRYQGQPGFANDLARAGNSAAARPWRQDRRSRRYAGDFLQDRCEYHVAAEAEARSEEPFRPDSRRSRDGAEIGGPHPTAKGTDRTRSATSSFHQGPTSYIWGR